MNKHTAALLEKHFDTAFAAPDGIAKLRELVLTLAMQGKLVEQNPNDQPASELLKDIEAEKKRLIKEKKIKAQKTLPEITADEIPYRLPSGWEWVRLNEIGLINPKNDMPDSEDAGFVPMSFILDGYSNKHEFEKARWGEIKKGYTHFANGDIGLAKITPCFENRKSCVFADLPNGVGAGTTELHVFRNSFNAIAPLYLLYFLKSPVFMIEAAANMTGSAGQKRVPTPHLIKQAFPLPPLNEQRRIVTKIDELMARCDKLEQLRAEQEQKRLDVHQAVIQQLLNEPQSNAWGFIQQHFNELYSVKENVEELRKAILQLAVMGRLVPQDSNDQPASELLKEIEAEKLRLIKENKIKAQKPLPKITAEEIPYKLPAGWEWARLGDLADFIDYRGKTPNKTDSGVSLITAKNIRFGFISREPREFISSHDYEAWMTRGYPRLGDLLFTTEAPLGNIAVIDIEEKFALAQRAICFSLYQLSMSGYLKWLIMSPYSQDLINENATGMTAKGIKAATLKTLLFPIPPLAEQQRIVAKVNGLMGLCNQLNTQIDLAAIKQTELLDAVLANM